MITAILITGLIGFSGIGFAADGPVVMMCTPLVKISKKANVVIMGSGFKPGQEVTILITSPEGLQTDIGYALKPVPKADETGTWATTWSAGRFVSRKIVPPGPCKITVTDDEYNPIAHSVVFFEAEKKKKKK
jgi:hypothetical protein